MAAPFRLRQQNALLQNKPDKLDSINQNTPTTPQSEINFFDTFRDSYIHREEDDDIDETQSTRSSVTTQTLAHRLNKLVPGSAPEYSPETTYIKIGRDEADRMRNLENELSRTPSRKSEDRKSAVIKSIKGDIGGNIVIVTEMPPRKNSKDEVKFVRNEPPIVVNNNPQIQTFSVSPSYSPKMAPTRPQRSPDRINSIPIPPRTHQRKLSHDDKVLQSLPHPPPLRGSSFDKETTMKYINRSQPQLVTVHQTPPPVPPVPPVQQIRPFQPIQPQLNQPQQFIQPARAVQPNQQPVQYQNKDTAPFQTIQQPVIPTSFRSRANSHPRTPPAPIHNHPPNPPNPSPSTQPPPVPSQPQEKKMYVGQRIAPTTSPSESPRTSNVSSLDIVPSVWPRGETLVRKSEDLEDVAEEEENTLKHSSGDEENQRHRRSRRKSKSRSRSRDGSTTDGEKREGEGRKRRRRRGGVVMSRRTRNMIKIAGIIIILNLIALDAVVIALFAAKFF